MVLRDTIHAPEDIPIDLRDIAGNWLNTTVSRGVAYAQTKIFEAIQAIRSTPPFTDASKLNSARVAVIDSGFDPAFLTEFAFDGQSFITLRRPDGATGVFAPGDYDDPSGHGTSVISIIAAANNGFGMSGVLNSVFAPGEQPFRVDVYQNRAAVTDDAGTVSRRESIPIERIWSRRTP